MADGKEQLEKLAKNNIGIRLRLQELLEPFKSYNNLEIHPLFIGGILSRIYYYVNSSREYENLPKEVIDGKLRKVAAMYEGTAIYNGGELKIYGLKKS